MGVLMSTEEARAYLESGHTGILSTIRADGSPALAPLWFVVLDDSVFIRTLARSHKVAHMRRDPRVSFMVESGVAWAELRAIVIHGFARFEEDPGLLARIDAALDRKYADFRMPGSAPSATKGHYAAGKAHVRIEPDGPPLTWDNSKLLVKGAG